MVPRMKCQTKLSVKALFAALHKNPYNTHPPDVFKKPLFEKIPTRITSVIVTVKIVSLTLNWIDFISFTGQFH